MNNHINVHDGQSWSSAPIHHSQWLQTTISDLDEKLDAMTTILEDGNSPNQEHMYCNWRKDLIQMLEEFGRSYRVLALAYNQLKSKTSHGSFHSGSLPSSARSKTICASCTRRETCNLESKKPEMGYNGHMKSVSKHSGVRSNGTNLDFEIQLEDKMTDFSTNENILMKIEDLELKHGTEDSLIISSKFESAWPALKYQMTKLTDDNLHYLEELVQRNDEKRETIRRLQLEVETLKHKNQALQNSSRNSNDDSEGSQSEISRPGRKSVSKLFRGCSP
ncbi:unnamed protein product [Lathyrus sativus]|nr:unnamed protein product [Lathyrus sativus]